LRALNILLENSFKNYPISGFFLDYVATDRTCETDSLPRLFNLMPARFTYRLDYLSRSSRFDFFRKKKR
jgi:hypothetical protein